MFNEAEEREALARILDQHDPEGGMRPVDIEYPDLSWWYPQVDAILAAGFHRTGLDGNPMPPRRSRSFSGGD